ncbi:MAG: Tex family protein [Oscillospiraceae bacterium]
MDKIVQILAAEFKKPLQNTEAVVGLIDEGNTIPFIARYRKEMTGSMDDQLLREMFDRLAYLRSLDQRRAEVKESIASQEKLTDELAKAIDDASTLAEVEDLYRPYKPKRRTRASIAREKGLEPLAEFLFAQDKNSIAPEIEAEKYTDAEKKVATADDALAGARDIIAENTSDDAEIRKKLRALLQSRGTLVSAGIKDEDSVYRIYYEFSEPVGKLQSHRILAINRGEREGFLKVSIELARPDAMKIIGEATLKPYTCATSEQVKTAIEDSYDRLIFPSIERDIRNLLTERADEQAIKTFALNLKPLLMQPPIKNMVTLGLDPAYRTGCKIAVVDGTGKVLDTGVVYPTPPHNKKEEAAAKLRAMIKKHGVKVISIGNGTASRESEQFVAELIHGTDLGYVIVNEAGASVYSASKLAANEFPEYDVSIRSAVSIARRLQDPLAELVKIDPKSIGVGQYQHDMPPQQLDESLGGVVEDCVNTVGVDLNTASAPLLGRVAGINAGVAKNIVVYREENGIFTTRKQLLKVPKLGAKAFVQCAGFIRVPESKNVLDNTSVHPESYDAAEKLLDICGFTMKDVKENKLGDLRERVAKEGELKAAEHCGVGVPTLRDIIKELQKPGRDPRDELPAPVLRSDVVDMDDLLPGMELTGTVRNVVDFGAFVDIGVHQDGLVHISRMVDRYIKHPSEVVKTGDIVTVWVLEVDKAKNRISLTMLKPKELDDEKKER